jgi:Ca2+-binding RTX toxin-like protein
MSPVAAIARVLNRKSQQRAESHRARIRRALTKRRKFLLEPLEPRLLLDATSPLLPAQLVALENGLQGFADWANTLDNFDKLSQQLPLVNQAVGDALDIGGLIKTKLVDPVVQHLNLTDVDPSTIGDQAPSLASVENLLKGLPDIGAVTSFLDANELHLGLVLAPGRSVSVPIALGANDLGFVAASTPTVNLDTSLNLNFQFGLDLTSGLSAAESFFVRVNGFSAQGKVDASGLTFGADLGFLASNVTGGTAKLDASLTTVLTDPNANGKITLTELQGTTLSSLASVSATSLLDVDLPVSASLGTFNLSGVVHIDDSNMFDATAPSVTQSGLDEGLNFNQLTPQTVLAVIDSLKGKFEMLSSSALFNTPIPFTSGQTLGGLLNLGEVFDNELIDLITASPTPNFGSVQDLANKLSSVLGSPVDYNPATDEVTFDLQISHSFSPVSVPINLSLSLGPIGGITTSSAISLTASADVALKMIIDLTPPGSGSYLLANNFFLEDASVAGQLTLSATDIDATARVGFVGIQITDGTAAASLAASLDLHKPGQPTQTRVSLDELTSALISNPTSLGTLERSGSATLNFSNISVVGGVITPSGSPSVSFSFPDITNLASFTPAFTNFSQLLSFENVSSTTIIDALKGIRDYLTTLSSFSFLSLRLPLLDKSVSELVDYASKFADKITALEADPAKSLQELAVALENAFGLAPGTVTVAMDGTALRIDLAFDAAYTGGAIPINLDLAALASGVPGLSGVDKFIDLGGSGLLTVQAGAALNLDLGLDLSTPSSPKPFVYDTTILALTAKVLASDLDFSAAIGPLGIFVRNGTAVLDEDGSGASTDPAAFTIALQSDPGDHRYLLTELNTSVVNPDLVGAVDINLPLFWPTESLPLGGPSPANNLHIVIADLSDIANTTTITTPDIAATFGSVDLLTQLAVVTDGLDLLLKTIQDALNGEVFGVSLPLVGSKLKDGAQFIQDIRTQVVAKLKAAPDQTLEAVQQAIFDALGPAVGGLNILTLDPNFADDGVGNLLPDFHDVAYLLSGDALKFTLAIHKTQALVDTSANPISFDIGFPGLGLKASGNVSIEVGFDFTLGFGVSKTDGFFFDTSAAQELTTGILLRIPDLKGAGSLGFLTLEVSDEDADSNPANNDPSVTSGSNKYDADGDGRLPSKVQGSFAINLRDPNSDGRLTFAELGSAGLSFDDVVAATIAATVDINLDARVSFGGSAVFPSLRTQFDLDWSMSGSTDASAESFGGVTPPTIAFNNVQLDIGSFFSDFAKPILDTVNDIIEPVRPLLDVINKRLPVFSDIGPLRDIVIALGGNSDPINEISLLDLALAYGSTNPQIGAIASAVEILNLISEVSAQVGTISGANILIPLGSFNLGGADPRAGAFNLSAINPNVIGSLAGDVVGQLRDLGGAAGAAGEIAADLLDKFAGNLGSNIGKPIRFPLLEDFTLAFKLLLGKPVELFVFDMPPLAFSADVEAFFPLLGPLGVQLNGSFSASLDLLFGYDTRGLAQFAAGGFSDPGKIFNGFYVSDTAAFDGSGPDIPEAILKASVEAFAAVNVVVASAGVGGGMFAKIEGNLNDPDADGKLYFDELVDELPFCFIDIEGALKVGITAFLKVGIGPLSYTKHFDIATATLVSFNYTCEPDPVLASVEGGVLQLNMGSRAGNRLPGNVDDPADKDGDEIFKITHKSGSAGSETVIVEAFGFKQEYSGFSKIEGDGGAGSDAIELVGVLTNTELWGDFRNGTGDGADVLQATGSGIGHVTLHGGGGNDELLGGDNGDHLFGDGGDDTIQGGAGNDSLDGGSGKDTVDGGEGDDTVRGGSGDDLVLGGPGADEMHGDDGDDNMSGEDGDDTIFGEAGRDSISGGQGADELHGGDDADQLQGDSENDTLFGDGGNDTIQGNDGDDELHGGDGDDSMEGNAGADKLYGEKGNDSLFGGTENDSVYGGDGNDLIRGEDGADYMEGGANNDTMYGGSGNDKMIGGSSTAAPGDPDGSDSMFGEAGDDTLLGDNGIIGSVTLIGGAGNDFISGGSENDLIYGQAGNDTLEGGTGNDTIFGNAGNDVLRGQEGNDYMEGGSGNDTLLGGVGDDDMFGDASEVPGGLDGGTAGADSLVGDAGNDWMLGDNGSIDRGAGTIATNPNGGAGVDTVYGGVGDDIIFGGGLGDLLVGDAADGTGRDLIVGDQGARSATQYVAQTSAVAGSAGNDSIFGSGGDDTLLGGDGGDSIAGDAGDDVIFGDNATVTLVGGVIRRLFTTDPTSGGDDTITGSTGADTIFGGKGNDSISGAEDPDIILGDNGVVALDDGTSDANDIFTTNPNDGGKDTITGGAGDDTILGGSGGDDLHGLGGDSLSGGTGNDIVIGDNGRVTRDSLNVVLRIETLLTGFGGDDRAFGDGGGADTIFGGFGDDSLVGGEQGDIIFGDNGVVVRNDGSSQANDLFSIAPTDGGRDTVDAAAGDDIVIGGTDADTLAGGTGSDVILGDHAYITRDASDKIEDIKTAFEDNGGSDLISGGAGNDVLIGGHAGDTMYGDDATGAAGASDGEDIMLGDNGEIVLVGTIGGLVVQGAAVDRITATDTSEANGGADTMSGNAKSDVILGGVNSDILYGDRAVPNTASIANDGDDIILGDNGFLDWSDSDRNRLELISSARDGLGGSDVISSGKGADVAIGGTAGDTMYGDDANASAGASDGDDIMLGDNGDVALAGTIGRLLVRGTAVDLITTTDESEATGGADTMSGNAGSDVVLGGVNGDILYGDRALPTATTILNDRDDILLGDNGLLDFTFGTDTDRNTLDLIRSSQDGLGKADVISGNSRGDVAMGGTAGDTIYGDDAAGSAGAADNGDMLLGDNGDVFLVAQGTASGGDLRAVFGSAVKTIRTTDTVNPLGTGGSDTISGNGGGDVIAGGVYGDFLYGDRETPAPATSALDGNDIILGDNGAFEWLSTGRLSEITGIDIAANNPALFAKYGTGAPDTDLTTLDLITTEQPTSGARDLIYGDEGKDFLLGGTDSDTMYGDDGNQSGTATNNDLMFGDHGRIYPQFSTLPGFNSRNFFAIDIGDPTTGNAAGGEGDRMWGEEGADVMLGQQGDDQMFGGNEDDDMIGGHNVAGGVDERAAPAITATLNPAMNDLMDGGAGNDAMAGDSATIWRRGDDVSARFRQLTAPTIYTTSNSAIGVNVGATMQSDPDDSVGRDITMLDHSFAAQANPFRYGSDVMVGGPGKDVMFGELGDDLMQGDGTLDGPSLAAPGSLPTLASRLITVSDSLPLPTLYYVFNVREQASDSDDYMEGNGGNDLMYGDLGQDDMIGGSSSLFGLGTTDPSSATLRPDGSDTMFGGAGIDIGRNEIGDGTVDANGNITATSGHALDADYMMGDNANIFRLVQGGASGINPTDSKDVFLVFAYDNYAGGLRIIPRASQPLDYTLGGADYKNTDASNPTWNYVNGAAGTISPGYRDNGAADMMHGESGDDVIFGMTGSDVLFGEGQDDDIIGGYGNDWISGGTGQDGVLGDDGLIYSSRNGTAEPLNGIAATTQQTISTPGQLQYAIINVTGDLKKTAELIPFSYDPRWIANDDEFPDNDTNTPFADDIIFGGLGSDFLHGGSGDDAISGAEALDHAYAPTYDVDGNATGLIDLGYAAASGQLPSNPGDVLAFNPLDLDGRHLNNRFRAGEFALYDEYDPLRRLQLDGQGNLWKSSAQGAAYEFLLNFNKDEGVLRPGGTVPKATGQQTETYGPARDDGNDAIFGDNGNDWLVGGTGRDDMYGGWGNDLISADDDPTTDGGLNDQPDTHPTYEDRAYGGAGRDVLIANTGGDRLIDWVGEYNTYLVPYAPFGEASVSRTLQPQLQEFLYALSKADGADQSQSRDTGTAALRNGEPAGELGLVLQKDFAWQDQTGAPADPQAGNIPGGKRDVLRSAGFDDGQAQGFFADSGTWTVTGGRYQVAPTVSGGDAVSVFYVDGYVPTYFEMLATINAVKPTGGTNANAYLVFDYQSPTNFKFAGINVSTNKLEIGHRNAQGWIVDTQAAFPGTIKSGTDYNVFLAVNGTAVTLIVNNQVTLTYTFAPRVDAYGISHGLNDGMVGLGAKNAKAQIDNVTVQRVAPVTTFSQMVDFSSGTTSLFPAPVSGAWGLAGGRYDGTAGATSPAIALTAINVTSYSLVDLSAVLRTTGAGGFVFDEYSPTDFKFVTIAAGQVTLGHRTDKGWFVDATYINAGLLPAGTDYTLGLTLKGTTVSVTLDGQVVLSRAYNALVTDGNFGLFGRSGTTSFDRVTVKSDSPNLLNQAFALTADSAPAGAPDQSNSLTEAQVASVAQAAMREWSGVAGTGALDQVRFELVNDLPGNAVAWSIGDGTILVDMNAAGYGWFVDASPYESGEYFSGNGTLVAGRGSDAFGRMDLLTALMHEMGHVLGLEHGAGSAEDVMGATLAAGERHLGGHGLAGELSEAPATTTGAGPERWADLGGRHDGIRALVDWDGEIGGLLGSRSLWDRGPGEGALRPLFPAFDEAGSEGWESGRGAWARRGPEGSGSEGDAEGAALLPSASRGWDWRVEAAASRSEGDETL